MFVVDGFSGMNATPPPWRFLSYLRSKTPSIATCSSLIISSNLASLIKIISILFSVIKICSSSLCFKSEGAFRERMSIDQYILWSFLHPVATNWSILAVRAQTDKTAKIKLLDTVIHDKFIHYAHPDTVTQRTTFFSCNTMFISRF